MDRFDEMATNTLIRMSHRQQDHGLDILSGVLRTVDREAEQRGRREAFELVMVMTKPSSVLIDGPRRQLCREIYNWAKSKAETKAKP